MPTTFLDGPETAAVRDLVEACARRPADTDAVFDVLDELQALIGCDLAAFNLHDTPQRRLHHAQRVASGERQLASPQDLAMPDDEPFWRWYWRCAPCSLPDRIETPVVNSISECYSAREWLEHPMCEVLSAEHPVVDELMVSNLHAPGQTRRLLFIRCRGTGFGERERFLLTLLGPHIDRLLAGAVTSPSPASQLTDRQREVLRLVRLGMANKQIAQALGISLGTVRKHLEHTYVRLGVHSRTEALRAAALDQPSPPTTRTVRARR